MSGPLEAIVSLQKTLTELAAAEQRLNSIPDWMLELHEEHSQQKAEIDAVDAESSAAEQERREAEGSLADAEELLKRYQEQLGKVSTQREYGALLKEIDTAKEQITSSEHTAIEAVERKDLLDAKLGEMREAFRDLDTRYKAELKKWERKKPSVAKAAKALSKRSEELRADVPRNFLVLFDRLFERSQGEALSRVHKIKMPRSNNAMWHCHECSYNVRPQIVVEIREKGGLNQCDSCKRILYWEAED